MKPDGYNYRVTYMHQGEQWSTVVTTRLPGEDIAELKFQEENPGVPVLQVEFLYSEREEGQLRLI